MKFQQLKDLFQQVIRKLLFKLFLYSKLIIKIAARNLSLYQRERMEQDPVVGMKVADIIRKFLK